MLNIKFEPEKDALERITSAIGGVAYKAPTILKDASNATGKYAMNRIFREIEKRYDYDDQAIRIKKAIKRKSATYANPRTIIQASSTMNKLLNFHVSPRTVAITGARPDVYKAHVLKGNGDKPVIKGGFKGFVVRFQNGHEELVARNSKNRYPVKTLFAPSETHMARHGFKNSEEKLRKNWKRICKSLLANLLKVEGKVDGSRTITRKIMCRT